MGTIVETATVPTTPAFSTPVLPIAALKQDTRHDGDSLDVAEASEHVQ
jgi:hypothetical protein